jgi:hypothetical protein
MSFLDRFKIQPKYKSADADVRAQAVAELGAGPLTDEDRAILVALANEDPDPRVRRAAAARIEDVGVLASMATRDADEEIRGELVNRLAGIAVGEDAEAATRALAALTDPKQISTVAKSSPVESVRTAAVISCSAFVVNTFQS